VAPDYKAFDDFYVTTYFLESLDAESFFPALTDGLIISQLFEFQI